MVFCPWKKPECTTSEFIDVLFQKSLPAIYPFQLAVAILPSIGYHFELWRVCSVLGGTSLLNHGCVIMDYIETN